MDVKSGYGGLRDVEFLVQGLQLIHGPENPELLEGNTLAAIDLLEGAGFLPGPVAADLKEDYCFLRRVEHFLQILEDQKIHALPREPRALQTLAGRIIGVDAGVERFMEELEERLHRIRKTHETYLAAP